MRYAVTDCIYGGNRVWIERGTIPETLDLAPIMNTMDILCKWGGYDKISEHYWAWEVASQMMPAIHKFLTKYGYTQDSTFLLH